MNADIENSLYDGLTEIKTLKVDGGASANDLLMQMQSDFSGIDVQRSSNPEATALGAAFLAGLATDFYKNREELVSLNRSGKTFSPSVSNEERIAQNTKWHKAIKACRAFAEEE